MILQLILIGCSNSLMISNSTREEMLEGVELFIGGSVTAAASSWVTALLSSPMLALSEVMIRALTGGISSLIFILLAHLLHLIFTRGEGDDHSVDKEKIGSGSGAIVRGGTSASASGGAQAGGCCPGCSIAYCNAIQQKKDKKYVPPAEEDEFSLLPHDEHYFNFKDSSVEQENIAKPPECAFGFCKEISPASGGIFPFSTLPAQGTKANIGRKRISYPKHMRKNRGNRNQNGNDFSLAGSGNFNQEDHAPLDTSSAGKSSAVVAEDIAIVEAANTVHF